MLSNSYTDYPKRLGGNVAYRFEGDFVHLSADISFSDADLAAGEAWALQLWASDNGFPGSGLSGVKVAEMEILPMAGGLTVAGCCSAMPPAGVADQVLGLALVAYAADGLPQVRDLAVYAATESFFQPRLLGNVYCTVANGEADLYFDAISSPRPAENLSGTMAVEVWALDTPYAGGSWAGNPVASLILGELGGGNEWTACHFKVPASMASSSAVLTVMLREWTPSGYVTRDYRNFFATPAAAEPVVTSAPLDCAKAAPEDKPILPVEAAKTPKVAAAHHTKAAPNLAKQIPAKKKKSGKAAGKAGSSKHR